MVEDFLEEWLRERGRGERERGGGGGRVILGFNLLFFVGNLEYPQSSFLAGLHKIIDNIVTSSSSPSAIYD